MSPHIFWLFVAALLLIFIIVMGINEAKEAHPTEESAYVDAMVKAFQTDPIQLHFNKGNVSEAIVTIRGRKALARWDDLDNEPLAFIYDGDENTVNESEMAVIIRAARKRAYDIWKEKRTELDKDFGNER